MVQIVLKVIYLFTGYCLAIYCYYYLALQPHFRGIVGMYSLFHMAPKSMHHLDLHQLNLVPTWSWDHHLLIVQPAINL